MILSPPPCPLPPYTEGIKYKIIEIYEIYEIRHGI